MKRSFWKLCPAALALLALVAAVPAAEAAVFIPNRTTDSADGACNAHCSLREAILAANARAGEDVIVLNAGVYRLSLPGAGEDLGATGDLDVRDDLVLLGDGAVSTVIDAGQIDRVLDVVAGVTVEIRDVTLRNGRVQGQATVGGGVLNHGVLTLARSIVTANTAADGFGGGIYTDGASATTSLTVTESTISENTAGGGGGGIAIGGSATLANVTISGNRSLNDFGGGLYIFSDSDSTISNATITGNSAALRGGGAFVESSAFIGAAPEFSNSILAGNSASSEPDCSGSAASTGYNLVGNGTGCAGFAPANNDLEGNTGALLDPRLGPLAGNGGPTPTHALLAGSPALNAGNPAAPGSGGAACQATDQRTTPRPGGARCDIGAFEQTSACVAGGNALCLQEGRFKVTAAWATGATSGEAGAVTLTSDTGYFWFFDPANVEVTVKVLNGCPVNNRFWVFLSGLTNVRVDVTVTDTQTGQVKTYTNPNGRVFRAQLDTSAFATCTP